MLNVYLPQEILNKIFLIRLIVVGPLTSELLLGPSVWRCPLQFGGHALYLWQKCSLGLVFTSGDDECLYGSIL